MLIGIILMGVLEFFLFEDKMIFILIKIGEFLLVGL